MGKLSAIHHRARDLLPEAIRTQGLQLRDAWPRLLATATARALGHAGQGSVLLRLCESSATDLERHGLAALRTARVSRGRRDGGHPLAYAPWRRLPPPAQWSPGQARAWGNAWEPLQRALSVPAAVGTCFATCAPATGIRLLVAPQVRLVACSWPVRVWRPAPASIPCGE